MTTATHLGATARLHLRVQPNLRSLLERAAALSCQDLSSFITSTLAAAAEKVVEEKEVWHLQACDHEAFWKAWNNPEPLPPSWKRGAAMAAQLGRGSGS